MIIIPADFPFFRGVGQSHQPGMILLGYSHGKNPWYRTPVRRAGRSLGELRHHGTGPGCGSWGDPMILTVLLYMVT